MTEQEQIETVSQNGYAIKYIDNPSEAVQFAAIEKNWRAIWYIENPSKAVKDAAEKMKKFYTWTTK